MAGWEIEIEQEVNE